MCRAARARDDDLKPAVHGIDAVVPQTIRGPMGRDDAFFVRYAKRIQDFRGFAQSGPIGLAAHYDPDAGSCHLAGPFSLIFGERHYSQRRPMRNARGCASGDDVRGETVFDKRDPVFQLQFALFETPQSQLIRGTFLGQGVNRIVEIAMFTLENSQLDTQHFIRFHRQIRRSIHVSVIPLFQVAI